MTYFAFYRSSNSLGISLFSDPRYSDGSPVPSFCIFDHISSVLSSEGKELLFIRSDLRSIPDLISCRSSI